MGRLEAPPAFQEVQTKAVPVLTVLRKGHKVSAKGADPPSRREQLWASPWWPLWWVPLAVAAAFHRAQAVASLAHIYAVRPLAR